MSIAVLVDQPVNGPLRRALVHGGAVNVTCPSPASTALVMFARKLIGDAFGGRDPELAQFDLPAAEHDAILATLTWRFAHHPETTRIIGDLLLERGADPETTYVGPPRLSASTGNVSGADAWRPCRDTWCSAPPAQLDHWVPVFDVDPDDAMTLYPSYFSRAIANDSASYDHHDPRRAGRPRPGPTEPVDPFSATTFVTSAGGVLQFSGQHLRSDAPTECDRTRFAVEFDSVDVGDIRAGLGARNVDGRCAGSSIRDFARAVDRAPIPDDVCAALDRRGEPAPDRVRDDRTRPAYTEA
ncbi:hypothetical protein H7K45_04865 [Mycobacterium yunnanensis]|uniref:Phytanoyl-CoA dioxygenase (PhyH) n=1 Tax=Mycobacterium yunnanensis TaxID=368477 RepID=A0A9X2YYA2_9MYCO|nr:hypothetical protein [Mycobacterium yunnanensis]MCV7419865.1 hypothetical protein [Mycobacterium yunnanensis]